MKYRLTDLNYRAFAVVERSGVSFNPHCIIPSVIADEFRCSVDDIEIIEQAESTTEEIITIRGEAVGRVLTEYGWSASWL